MKFPWLFHNKEINYISSILLKPIDFCYRLEYAYQFVNVEINKVRRVVWWAVEESMMGIPERGIQASQLKIIILKNTYLMLHKYIDGAINCILIKKQNTQIHLDLERLSRSPEEIKSRGFQKDML